eukprot:CAMPEP_0197452212 /NCGR_PEP_ID=MMETSP1175-20131217/31476_1 /TAXON_ID=1003142 /ORGANISM="Triceratium dubium, Strain CCMP147" /LENGTH=194 /DNA_ID=CAMNT_0042985163 /DNA_START=177 /DNA_END=758 /DNA_ORIENTATION=-
MAISALAEHMKITKPQLLELRDACLTYTVRGDGEDPTLSTLSRRDFHKAMSEARVPKPDREILDGLFTMWDKVGDDRTDTMLFITGISPLASILDIETKLRFAFKVYDVDRSGVLTPGDMESIFAAINATASYLGDAVMTSQQIEIVVEDVFKSPTSAMTKDTIVFDDHIDEIASHPMIVQFASCGGQMRYGSK